MKKILIVLAVVSLTFFSKDVLAQQDPQYSMYMFNQQVINPAYAGSRDALSFTALYRHQWTGLPGAPKTFSVSVNGALKNERIGLGGYIASDNLGVTNIITMAGDYAYRLPIKKDGHLSFGVRALFNYYQMRFTELSTQEGGDPGFSDNISFFKPNFGFAAYYQNDFMYAGFSVPHLLNGSLDKEGDLDVGTDAVARQWKHYFWYGGFIFDAGPNIKIKPSFMLKYVQHMPLSADINVNILIKDQFWVGASYRVNYGVVFMAEYLFAKRIRLGYAYDYTHTELNQVTSGSHEIMLGYDLIKENKYLTPRRMSYF